MITTLLIFSYETCDSSKGCQYWQDFVIVKSSEPVDVDTIEDGIASYMESEISEDKDYEEMTADIMDHSELGWHFLNDSAVSINRVYTFWI